MTMNVFDYLNNFCEKYYHTFIVTSIIIGGVIALGERITVSHSISILVLLSDILMICLIVGHLAKYT